MKTKKILIIIAIVLIIAIAIVYFVFIRKNGNSETSTKSEINSSQNLSSDENTSGDISFSEFPYLSLPVISRIVKSETLSPVLSDSGEEIIYFDTSRGDFYSIGIDGNGNKAVSDKSFTSVKSVNFSPKADKVAITFSDENDDDKVYIYDFFIKSLNKLSPEISSVAFSPDSESIVYQYVDKQERIYNISRALSDGSSFQKLKDFYSPGAIIKWEEGFGKIFITDLPSSNALSSLYSVTTSGDFSKIIDAVYGLQVIFSPGGDGMIYSYISPDKKTLSLVYANAKGKLKYNLRLATFASKSAISHDGKYAYVAVPVNIKKGSEIQIAKYSDTSTTLTKDQIWRVDLGTGEKVMILNPEDYNFVVDVRNPFLSHDGKLMFFWDKGDKGVYAINLSKLESEKGLEKTNENKSSPDTDTNNFINPEEDNDSSENNSSENNSSEEEEKAEEKTTPEQRLFEKLGF